MAQAKYTVMVPLKDNLGQQLKDLATAGHHWLFLGPGPKVEGTYIEGPKKGNWRDNPQEEFNHLVTVAEDTPEMDSTVKQLAAHIADVANQWGIFVMKEGKNGIQSWTIPNNKYVEGQGADSDMLAPESSSNGLDSIQEGYT